jgi:hypothetical protein
MKNSNKISANETFKRKRKTCFKTPALLVACTGNFSVQTRLHRMRKYKFSYNIYDVIIEKHLQVNVNCEMSIQIFLHIHMH